jgi:hypothetical protein
MIPPLRGGFTLKRFTQVAALFFVVLSVGFAQAPGQSGGNLSHNVYFTLKDKSPQAAAKLAAACRTYLKGHPGEVFFAVGTIANDLNREVNDRDFQVSLNVVFRGKADHDRYQVDARHKRFLEENQAAWEKVRVFDSYVSR